MNNEINSNIQCSVTNCAYHDPKNYCTLNQIKVGNCESDPTTSRGTECDSFKVQVK